MAYYQKKSNKPASFLFMDYETFNRATKGGRASQFAAIRTNDNLEITDTVNLFCEQIEDNIPSPVAAAITHLTPQKIQRFKEGKESPPESKLCSTFSVLNEHLFTERVLEQMQIENTCTLGYNSINFDDEYTRNLAYRNLMNPYDREWKNGNSRFDVYFLIMATYLLRPHLLNFPQAKNRETGELEYHPVTNRPYPSFKLEELSKANGIIHTNAHDAFSDVEATIELMKIIKNKDPEFFNKIFNLRKKENVASFLSNYEDKPFLHISSFYGKENYSMAVVRKVADHPTNKNAIICFNLMKDAQMLIDLDPQEIKKILYAKKEELIDQGLERIGLQVIKTNTCPIFSDLDEIKSRASEFNLQGDVLRANNKIITLYLNQIKTKVFDVFNNKYENEPVDSDLMIYTGGFFAPNDMKEFESCLNSVKNNNLNNFVSTSQNPRVQEMIFKFKARNYPESLNERELEQWKNYRSERLTNKDIGAELTFETFEIEMNEARKKYTEDSHQSILDEIQEYVENLKKHII